MLNILEEFDLDAALRRRPEILLVDEVLGAGDASFQEKARQRMSDFVARASIFVLASHSPDLMKQFCTRMIRLKHGKIISDEPIVPDPPNDETPAAEPIKERTA